MQFRTYNTKNKKEYTYEDYEVRKLFECDSSRESIITQEDYDYFINHIEEFTGEDDDKEEVIEDYKKYWNQCGKEVLNEEEYLKAIIEYETWTSPKGVAPVYRVIEVIK
jgi:transcription termination factor NusB